MEKIKDQHITIRASSKEVAILNKIVNSVPLRSRSQYIKAAINAYAKKVIFQ